MPPKQSRKKIPSSEEEEEGIIRPSTIPKAVSIHRARAEASSSQNLQQTRLTSSGRIEKPSASSRRPEASSSRASDTQTTEGPIERLTNKRSRSFENPHLHQHS